MCGIIGILGKGRVASDIVDALRRLEYRGYDSAGIATLQDGHLQRRRASGKLKSLEKLLDAEPLAGSIGIGHTRWATHGAPTEKNAHPHMSDTVAVVHNGIIENFRELRVELMAKGHVFTTDTDTESVVHLITEEFRQVGDPVEAVRRTLSRLKGAFALAILFAGHDDLVIVARRGSPLAIGYGDGEMYLGSDAFALAPFTESISYLDEGDWAVLRRSGVEVFDNSGEAVTRPVVQSGVSKLLVDKGNHAHFMAKEIHEQPEVISHTLANYIDMSAGVIRFPDVGIDFSKVSRITISACGTAYYAALIAKYWFERYARIPVEVDVASEMRYREPPLAPDGLAIVVSQSGETADTLAALRYCREQGQTIASVVNVTTSTIARESDAILPTLAGPEIGVASTKAFTCQMTVLACLALAVARARGEISLELEQECVAALCSAPGTIAQMLNDKDTHIALAKEMAKARDVFYLGRGTSYPLALEGALKLKEISYIHAEGFASGELKHGPIALIDESVPVVVLAPLDDLFEKTISNMQEVAARGGKIVFVSDAPAERAGCTLAHYVHVPSVHPFITPLVYAQPVQFMAYYTAVAMGTDVDQPRNLAKSVTVE